MAEPTRARVLLGRARAILDDTPVPTPLADAVANMSVIERVLASAEKQAWL